MVGDKQEPYRAFISRIIKKMKLTLTWVESELDGRPPDVATSEMYLKKEDLMDELMVIHRSLYGTGNVIAADGDLTDMIRNLSAFGLTLVPLDVRQESDRHEEAVDAITRHLGLGSYSQWDEETKINWLTTQISSKRPLIRAGVWHEHKDIFSESAIDVLETFRMIAEQPPDSLGAYVISQATSASDVLAVVLLQLDAGRKDLLRVSPLFETLDDLNTAEATMRTLFSLPVYMGLINGKQEVMIGYSDSAKDAGRLAANWAQFVTQQKLSEVAKEYGIDMSFFHGKGGTVGRGGNPQTFLAITSHPPDTINGKFRVTEQGEMINQNFGYKHQAERTMDIYTAAVLTERIIKRSKPSKEWTDMMDKLSDISCAAYRKVVREDERFVPYFRSATPELELNSLNIGSRPAKRKPGGGVESLRAIPWNFAWTQTRFNLPTWLGVGEAIGTILKSNDAPILRDMYKNWDSFRTMVDLVEMVLTKSEPAMAKHYDELLVTDEQAKDLGREVRSVHLETESAILDLTEHTKLGENNMILQRALVVRNPYVDCLNILQAETLKRTREHGDWTEDKDLKDALMSTIGGIAAGMGNTG
jgi:phosphoenolpyruvate carboxylase